MLDVRGRLRDQYVVGQRLQLLVRLPLATAVVLLGALGQDFDDDSWVLDDVGCAGDDAGRPANDGNVGVHVLVGGHAELQVGAERLAAPGELRAERAPDPRSERRVAWATTGHRENLAAPVLVARCLLALPREKVVGSHPRTDDDAHHPSTLPRDRGMRQTRPHVAARSCRSGAETLPGQGHSGGAGSGTDAPSATALAVKPTETRARARACRSASTRACSAGGVPGVVRTQRLSARQARGAAREHVRD